MGYLKYIKYLEPSIYDLWLDSQKEDGVNILIIYSQIFITTYVINIVFI